MVAKQGDPTNNQQQEESQVNMLKMKTIAASIALAGMAGWVQAGPGHRRMLGAEAGESWLHTNGNYGGHRFSTLTAINASNAKDLKLAWTFSPGGKTDAQATPSYHDGLLYFPQDNKVFAIDARHRPASSGSTSHKLPDDWGGYNVSFFTGKHRGVAIYGDNVYFLSNDAKLHAIDYEDRQGQVGQVLRRVPLSEGLRQSQGLQRLLHDRGADGHRRHDHRADERHRHRRPGRATCWA